MSFTAAIDISTFIWCKEDFNQNKKQYFILKTLAPNVYSKIRELKLPILLRKELYQLIISEFPYNMVQEIGYDFQKLTLEFLTDTFSNWAMYSDDCDESVNSYPDISKPYFSNKIQAEMQNQICHLFNNNEIKAHKFIVYNYFFMDDKNLHLIKDNITVEVDTFNYNTELEIDNFFDKFKLRFEHNPKHRREAYHDYDRNEFVSPFSCYFNQGRDEAQKLLDNAIFYNGNYYNFDLNNNVYVRFVRTVNFTFHGHDISDEKNNVPNAVKKKYSKNGRTF